MFDLVSSAGQAYTVFISQKSSRKGAGLPLEWQQTGEAEADEASEVDFLEVEYLLLTLDFGDLLFLPAGFGPLQAALLEVFEPGGDRGSLRRAGRVTAVLWEPREREQRHFNLTYFGLCSCWTSQVLAWNQTQPLYTVMIRDCDLQALQMKTQHMLKVYLFFWPCVVDYICCFWIASLMGLFFCTIRYPNITVLFHQCSYH